MHKYATSNNRYRSNYDKNKQTNFLIYLDGNSFYGFAMIKHFLTGNLVKT